MGSLMQESLEQLKVLVNKIEYNYTGWKSVFYKKKYTNIQFVEKTYELFLELFGEIDKQQLLIQELMKKQAISEAVQNKYNEELSKHNEELKEIMMEIKALKQDAINHDKYKEQLEKQLGATARQLMGIKWKLIDCEAEKTEKDDDILRCKICDYEDCRDNFETLVAECKFNGGRLERYICPKCGVIFGPTKFAKLTQDEINDDYSTHYLGFHEGDSTQKELDAFYMLKPEKTKMYLNYGCGSWSESLEMLKSEGYQVYGYEPYAPKTDNPYMITDINKIEKMRFDGIYSNDVIEHLIDPVNELRFMKGLLKNKNSKMSHSTSCYIYKHEKTRFHTHFFTGKSLEVLCKKIGLNIVDHVNEVDTKDFICYVYEPKGIQRDYTDKLLGLQKTEKSYVLPDGDVMYGPYITISGEASKWKLVVRGINSETDKVIGHITEKEGRNTLQEFELTEGENIILIKYTDIIKNMEFVVWNKTGHALEIKKLEMIDEI